MAAPAIGRSIAKRWTEHNRARPRAFERLERHAGKLARAVLRGLGGSNPARLPGAPGNRCLYPEGDGLQLTLRFSFQPRLTPSVRRLAANSVRGVSGVLCMFGADVLTFREFMMGEPLPLATLHNAVLEFLRGRDDVVLFCAQAVNA